MFGTTKGFLDYFSLKKLDDLPPLADLSDWESLRVQLNLPEVEGAGDIDLELEVGGEAEAHELPVLYPEGEEAGDEAAVDDEAADSLDDSSIVVAADVEEAAGDDVDEDVPVVGDIVDAEAPEPEQTGEQPAEEPEEELVVNKWPDPLG
jgi:segregation and condensation protein B